MAIGCCFQVVRSWCLMFSPDRYFVSVAIPFAEGWLASLAFCLYRSTGQPSKHSQLKKKKGIVGPLHMTGGLWELP